MSNTKSHPLPASLSDSPNFFPTPPNTGQFSTMSMSSLSALSSSSSTNSFFHFISSLTISPSMSALLSYLLHFVSSSTFKGYFVLTFLLIIWFTSSILSTLVNKTLMSEFPYPVSISAVHMFSSAIVDLIIILSRGLTLRPFRSDVFQWCLPVAATINFGKTLTYVSYGMVPASLTHTAKASSPLFSVILTKLMFNKWPPAYTCLSLLPLTIGVSMSAITELNLAWFGFLAAVAASLANVLNSIYTKRALSHVSCPDPLIFHMYTSVTATAMLAPYAFIKDGSDMYSGIHSFDDSSSNHTNSNNPSHDVLFATRLIFASLALHYLQNISSIYFLSQVSVLTHQVSQSLKRLLVIACSVLYFHNNVTSLNLIGMALALVGFFAYSMAKSQNNHLNKPNNKSNSNQDHELKQVLLGGDDSNTNNSNISHSSNNQRSSDIELSELSNDDINGVNHYKPQHLQQYNHQHQHLHHHHPNHHHHHHQPHIVRQISFDSALISSESSNSLSSDYDDNINDAVPLLRTHAHNMAVAAAAAAAGGSGGVGATSGLSASSLAPTSSIPSSQTANILQLDSPKHISIISNINNINHALNNTNNIMNISSTNISSIHNNSNINSITSILIPSQSNMSLASSSPPSTYLNSSSSSSSLLSSWSSSSSPSNSNTSTPVALPSSKLRSSSPFAIVNRIESEEKDRTKKQTISKERDD